jgi:hypothetical protein
MMVGGNRQRISHEPNYSSVSSTIDRTKRRIGEDRKLRVRIEEIKSELIKSRT